VFSLGKPKVVRSNLVSDDQSAPGGTEDDYKNTFENSKYGVCPVECQQSYDAIVDASLEFCKANEDASGRQCKGAWKADEK
jgi:hypothetical protein